MEHKPPEARSRVALYDLALALGRIEGMVGQALHSLTNHERTLEEHGKRITALEAMASTQKAYILGAGAVVAAVWYAISFIIDHWEKIFQ